MAPKLPINKYLHELRTQKPQSLLFLSIGNPSPRYDKTRHSVGHAVLGQVVQWLGGMSGSSEIRNKVEMASLTSNPNIYLGKSETFMNLSGDAVTSALKSLPQPYKLVIVHDDMDLEVGEVKFKLDTTTFRGHNGLRDISQKLHSPYARLRIGIGAPHERSSSLVERYVLSKFTREQAQEIEDKAVPEALRIVKEIIDAMSPTRSADKDAS